MSPSIDELMSKLGISRIPARWQDIYEDALAIHTAGKNPLLRPSYYDELHQKYGVLPNFLDIYKEASAAVAALPELSLFFTLLCRAMQDRDAILSDIAELELPTAPQGMPTLPYDMLTALSMLQAVPANHAELVRRGLPADARDFALQAPEYCVAGAVAAGRPRLFHFDYFQRAYDCRLHRFGRLEFEFPRKFPDGCRVFADKEGRLTTLADGVHFHRSGQVLGARGCEDPAGSFDAVIEETADGYIGHPYKADGRVSPEKIRLDAAVWTPSLSPGDPIVALHIPSSKLCGPLTPEAVDDAFAKARKILSECYPEFPFKAFFCSSWLIDPTVSDLLEGSGNLAAFNRRFTAFSVTPSPATSVFGYVFGRGPSTPIAELPADTRLRQAIRSHYLAGGAIYDTYGFILA